ncbi:MAG: hypothetical protein HOF10_12425, partial [Chloroflexi bacterium]|nr:hypothetical protein [Chloroflexota bacterium]
LLFFVLIFLTVACTPKAPQLQIAKYINFHGIQYERILVSASELPWVKSKLFARKGEYLIALASGQIRIKPNGEQKGPYARTSSTPNSLFIKVGDGTPEINLYQAITEKNDYNEYIEIKEEGNIYTAVSEAPENNDDWSKGIYNEHLYSDNEGFFIVDLFLVPKTAENKLYALLVQLAGDNPEDRTFRKQIDQFFKSQSYIKINNNIIWNRVTKKDRLSAYLNFITQYPNHPKLLDALELISNRLLVEYREYFWDFKKYIPLNVNKDSFGGFWSNHTNQKKIGLFQKLSEFGYSMADVVLADIFYLGIKKFKPELAYQLAQKAAAQNNVFGKFLTAKFLFKGVGIEQDTHQAQIIFNEIKNELESRVKDENRAVKIYPKNELPLAQYCLGWMYGNGMGTAKNKKSALELYQKSAREGYLPARYNLALAHQLGWGGTKDYQKSEKTIALFAKYGFKKAQHNLSWMFENDRTTNQYLDLISQWYQPTTEVSHWKFANKLKRRDYYQMYLERYPNGNFIDLAKKEIRKLDDIRIKKEKEIEAKKAARNNEIYISRTGDLMWQNTNFIKMKSCKISDIKNVCSNFNLAGFSDWQAPTLNELKNLRKEIDFINPELSNNMSVVGINAKNTIMGCLKEAFYIANGLSFNYEASMENILASTIRGPFIICNRKLRK